MSVKKQEFIELLKNAKTDRKGNLYYIGKEYCGKRVYFATVNTICDDFVKEYCCDENGECYHYNRHFTNNDDTIEIQIVKGEKQKPKTNFDRITSSVESLAENLVESVNMELVGLRHKAGDGKLCATWEEAVQRTIEWLQKEAENG